MRYSDVAEKYYKDTKNRILQNVLAAETNDCERSRDIIIGETENKEKIIMTSVETRKNTAKIRNNKGMIAAACAIVMMGSGALAMNTFKSADTDCASSRPDNIREVVATTSDEESSSVEKNNDTEVDPDTETEIETDTDNKTEEKKEDISRAEVKEKKTDSSIAETKEKVYEIIRTEVKESTTVTADGQDNNNDTQTNEISDEIDRGRHAEAGKDFMEKYSTDYDFSEYELDEDNYVSNEFLSDYIRDNSVICEGTITSKEIYGRTRKDEFKPLKEYSESELENVGRLYYRLTINIDGACYRGEEFMPYLSQDRNYDAERGEMVVIEPIPRKAQPDDDEFAPIYASKESEIDTSFDICNIGCKMLMMYNMNNFEDSYSVDGYNSFIYDCNNHLYYGSLDATNYILNQFKGGTPETAEQWINFIGENYIIKDVPSKRYTKGQVVNLYYSESDNGYIIYVAK